MKKIAAALALALSAAVLVACGGGGTSSTTSEEAAGETGGAVAGSTVKLEADPNGQLAYTTTEATAKAGKVTIEFDNPQSLPHDVAIENSNGKTIGKTEIVTEGTTTAVVDLKPGTYKYYCSVPGHRDAGMEGTLKVE